MKTIIIVSATIALTLAYPTNSKDSLPETKREKKSASYGSSLYGQAPAAAPSAYGPLPSAPAPCAAPHLPAPSPIAFYLAPAGHLPSGLHYRADNENEDQFESMMTSDDLDHMQARSYDAYGAAASAAAGPAVGLFPKANIGGCAIPLLLSCAPSVTTGKLLKAQQAAAAAPSAYNYRSNIHIEDEAKMEMEKAMMENHDHAAQWFEMERAGHPEFIHQHMLLPDSHQNHLHNHQAMPGAFPLPMPTFTHH